MTTLCKLSMMFFLIIGALHGFGKNYTVKLVNNRFDPASLSVYEGDSITWINESDAQQSLLSGSKCKADGIWNSGFIEVGSRFIHIFKKEGSFTYFSSNYCDAGMKGFVMINQRRVGGFTPNIDNKASAKKPAYLNYEEKLDLNLLLDLFSAEALDFLALKPKEWKEL